MTNSATLRTIPGGGPERERAILEGRFIRRRINSDLWDGQAWAYRCGIRLKVCSFQWFPVGVVLVLFPLDWDRFGVDVPATILENGLDPDWLNGNEPRPIPTPSLF